jgi:hypothetical protein
MFHRLFTFCSKALQAMNTQPPNILDLTGGHEILLKDGDKEEVLCLFWRLHILIHSGHPFSFKTAGYSH